jgi:hypothetical protein
MPFLAQMPREYGHEIGISLCCEHGKRVPNGTKYEPRDPLLEPQPERGSGRTVDNRNGTRRTPEQDRLDERAVYRRLQAFDMLRAVGIWADHEMSAPPPKLKKLRKKDEAAKAIERPKTI